MKNEITERGILMSTPMVQAIINGTKTETRRTKGLKEINEKPDEWRFTEILPPSIHDIKDNDWYAGFERINGTPKKAWEPTAIKLPYGSVGTKLYVKETFCKMDGEYFYKASVKYPESLKWKPSLFMPKAAARITMTISDIKVERLQDITEEGAIAEGVEPINRNQWKDYKNESVDGFFNSPVTSYASLWESINGTGSWELNPWVFVIKFSAIQIK